MGAMAWIGGTARDGAGRQETEVERMVRLAGGAAFGEQLAAVRSALGVAAVQPQQHPMASAALPRRLVGGSS